MEAELLAEAIRLIDELKPWAMRNNDTTGELVDLCARVDKLKSVLPRKGWPVSLGVIYSVVDKMTTTL